MEILDFFIWMFGFFSLVIIVIFFFCSIFPLRNRLFTIFGTISLYFVFYLINRRNQLGWSLWRLILLSLLFPLWYFTSVFITNYLSRDLNKNLTYLA